MAEYYAIESSKSLSHHGVKGMKWGQHLFGRSRVNVASNRSNKLHAGHQAKSQYHATLHAKGKTARNTADFLSGDNYQETLDSYDSSGRYSRKADKKRAELESYSQELFRRAGTAGKNHALKERFKNVSDADLMKKVDAGKQWTMQLQKDFNHEMGIESSRIIDPDEW